MLSAVLAALAGASTGHVVADGEIAEPDGVAPARTAEPTPAAPAPDLSDGRAYLTVLLPFAAPDEAGWRRTLQVVHALTADAPELWPGSVQVDGEWRPFTATDPPPPWWPLRAVARERGAAGHLGLAVASEPGRRLSQISLTATVDAATTGRLLLALAAPRPRLRVPAPLDPRRAAARSTRPGRGTTTPTTPPTSPGCCSPRTT